MGWNYLKANNYKIKCNENLERGMKEKTIFYAISMVLCLIYGCFVSRKIYGSTDMNPPKISSRTNLRSSDVLMLILKIAKHKLFQWLIEFAKH